MVFTLVVSAAVAAFLSPMVAGMPGHVQEYEVRDACTLDTIIMDEDICESARQFLRANSGLKMSKNGVRVLSSFNLMRGCLKRKKTVLFNPNESAPLWTQPDGSGARGQFQAVCLKHNIPAGGCPFKQQNTFGFNLRKLHLKGSDALKLRIQQKDIGKWFANGIIPGGESSDSSSSEEPETPDCEAAEFQEFRSVEGVCNDLDNPFEGASEQAQGRLLPAEDEDDVSDFPLVREISRMKIAFTNFPNGADRAPWDNEAVIGGVSPQATPFEASDGDSVVHTAWLFQIGQFLDHDLVETLTEEGPDCVCGATNTKDADCFNLQLTDVDPFRRTFEEGCIPFRRSDLVFSDITREEEPIQAVTSWVDASQIYGSEEIIAEAVRDFSNPQLGLLRVNTIRPGALTSSGEEQPREDFMPFPPNEEDLMNGLCANSVNSNGQCFLAGDFPRNSEQPALSMIHTIFVRLHNAVAEALVRALPNFDQDDEEFIFQNARVIVGAIWSNIAYNGFLKELLGEEVWDILIGEFQEYDPNLVAQQFVEFSTAAYRLHSLVPDQLQVVEEDGTIRVSIPLRDGFLNPDVLQRHGVDAMARGMSRTRSALMDIETSLQLDNFLFSERECEFGMDLFSLNMQRGRDHRIPEYDEFKKFSKQEFLDRARNTQDVSRFAFAEFPEAEDELLGRIYASAGNGSECSIDSDGFVTRDGQIVQDVAKCNNQPGRIDSYIGMESEKHVEGGLIGPTMAGIIGRQLRTLRDADRFYFENEFRDRPEFIDLVKSFGLAEVICVGTGITDVQPNPFLIGTAVPCEQLLAGEHQGTTLLEDIVDGLVQAKQLPGARGR